MATCKSCDAEIRWAETPNGKGIPLDPEPVENGNLVMVELNPGGPLKVRHVVKGEELGDSVPRYRAHFVTCPQGKQWSRKKKAKRST